MEKVAFAVLGARGFIGSRAVAWLRGRAFSVRAVARDLRGLEHDPDAKLADALDVPALASAFQGCDVVVHAVYTNPETAGRAMEATYAASEAAGVRRIVHVSTASVHGQAPPPSADERSPLRLWQEFAYNNAKVRAERALRRARGQGAVEIVMLRPGIVFGPRSRWVAEFADALLGGRAALVDRGRGVCNSIYVDNLVHAIELAAREADVDGEAFLVGDAERVTWADLYGPIALALGCDLSSVSSVEPPRHVAPWSDRLRDAARNSERLEPVRRVMAPATTVVRSLLRRGRPSAGAPSADKGGPFLDGMTARLQECSVKLPIGKAERLLRYQPPVSFEEGVRRTIAWMQTAGYPVQSDPAPLRPSARHVTPQFGARAAAGPAARAWLPRRSVHDVVVVGSGATGGWAAKELTAAGLDVLVLEAGRGWPEETAIRALQRVRRKAGYRVERDPRALQRQATQAKCYAWAGDPHAFVDDVDNPYATAEGKPFAWFRARQLGGRLAVRNHGLYFMRHSDFDFRAASRDGYGDDWPVAYADLVPFYERVERAMGIRGNRDGIAHLPESIYAGPSESFTSLHLDAKEAIERRWPARRVVGRRTASPPRALADAFGTGRLALRANAVASHVVLDKATGRASGVAFVDRRTGRAHEVRGRVVVLCASAIESARILLNSETPDGGRGLANSSGALGRYLMDHVYLAGLEGRRALPSRSPSDGWAYLYVPQFVNVGPASREPEFLRGYGIQLALSGDAVHAYVFGEMLPRAENHVSLDREVKDRWGIPAVRIDCARSDNERNMIDHMIGQTREMMSALGAEVEKPAQLMPPGASIHEVGTARMGRDPKSSVVDSFCQSWDVRNLFVADGASFVSQGVQNPTLTMMALTARCADFIVGALRRGEL